MRFTPGELTPRRVVEAAARRVQDLPHLLAWVSPGEETRRNRELLRRYRGRHSGRCFVIGNGPSLAAMDLSPLAREVTFGTNRIYLLFDRLGFEPTYYACVNELVLEQFHADIGRLRMPKFLGWNRRRLFAPVDERTMFFRTALTLVDFFGRDPTRTICSGGTVTFVALELAHYMGFREVVLIGVDHRFAESGTPNRTEVRRSERDVSHFHPDYFPKGSRWQLPDLRRSELAYELARRAFEADGGRILDATVGGACPVFEKVAYESVTEA